LTGTLDVNQPPARGRALTWIAIGFLTLDGVLLLLAAVWGQRPGLAIGGGICLALAAGVLALWRRHRRTLAEVREARRAVADEVRALRALLRKEPRP
jgi:multisubunit Na+/H+ antiporter MnhB subunit